MMLPPPPCRTICRCGLPQMKHAGQVDRNDALPVVGTDFEKTGGLTDADAVEQHIETAEVANRRRDRGVDARTVTDVEGASCGPAVRRADLRRGCLGRCAVDVGADHRRTLARETESARAADPAARTGDQCDLSFDSPHGNLPDVPAGQYIPYVPKAAAEEERNPARPRPKASLTIG
jgi:hypothetical protein